MLLLLMHVGLLSNFCAQRIATGWMELVRRNSAGRRNGWSVLPQSREWAQLWGL